MKELFVSTPCDSGLRTFGRYLHGIGVSRTTGWRWRAAGFLQTVVIAGRHYISDEEIRRFEIRAANGEFAAKSPTKPSGEQLNKADTLTSYAQAQ